jgi:uncharacterized RDD family membrane protein YckC
LDPTVTPSLRTRFACMVYEAMLLFGVLFIADWLFSTLLQQRHALQFRGAGQAWLFLVLGAYFAWFWSHGGQTLAMKTWRIRLVASDGHPVGRLRAVCRYLLAWLWFLPGFGMAWLLGAKGWMLVFIPVANVALWSLTVLLDRERQFLHDRIAGTRLVSAPPRQPS